MLEWRYAKAIGGGPGTDVLPTYPVGRGSIGVFRCPSECSSDVRG